MIIPTARIPHPGPTTVRQPLRSTTEASIQPPDHFYVQIMQYLQFSIGTAAVTTGSVAAALPGSSAPSGGQTGPCGVLVAAAGTAQRRRPGRPPAAALLERLRWQSLGHPSRWRWRAVGLSTSGVSAWAQALCWQQIGSQIEGRIHGPAFVPPV